MTVLPIPGLVGSHPLGALAAFGLLRVSSSAPAIGRVFLKWDLTGEPSPILCFERAVTEDSLIRDVLLPWMSDRWRSRAFGVGEPGQSGGDDGGASDADTKAQESRPAAKGAKNQGKALRWDQDIKVARETFAKELARAREEAGPDDRRDADHLSGYATDAREVKSASRGMVVATTALCMTAGNQSLLKLLRDLAFSLDSAGDWSRRLTKEKVARTDPEGAFRQALLAPWDFASATRDDGFLALGWDAESYYIAALRGQTTPALAPPRAAIWLAAEALALFPCVPVGRRARTRGFDAKGKVFRWPIWRQPLSLPAVRTALGLPALYEDALNRKEIRAFGIDRVYASGIIALTDYASFRPAVVLCDAADHFTGAEPPEALGR